MNSELKNLLIIDIETVSVSSSFETLPENLRHHWERKALQLRNDDEKSASDLYFEKAGIYAEFGKIIVIAVGIFHEVEGEAALRVTSFQDHDEAKLLNAFKVFLETKFNQHSDIVYNGPNVAGEGEQKIYNILKTEPVTYNHIVYGLDADLIMLSLMAYPYKIFLYRETSNFAYLKWVIETKEYVLDINFCNHLSDNQSHQ
jgi:hypothetical protein